MHFIDSLKGTPSISKYKTFLHTPFVSNKSYISIQRKYHTDKAIKNQHPNLSYVETKKSFAKINTKIKPTGNQNPRYNKEKITIPKILKPPRYPFQK